MPASVHPAPEVLRPRPGAPAARRPGATVAGVVIAAATALAYLGGLHGPFVYDDNTSIVYNASIRHLWPLWHVLFPPGDGATVSGRPLLNLTFALDYALGGLDVRWYHATSVLIHVLAALALFGLVHRTLRLPAVPAWLRGAALPTGFAAALIWGVHPLDTEGVSYVAQRAESLMSLFYLLTLYAFVRGVEPGAPRRWAVLTVAACLAGMATKENMVSAPLAALCLDRAFVAGTLGAAWRRRRGLYLALLATWIPLGVLVWTTGGNRGGTVGFNVGVGWLAYALTQGPALVRYAALALWPHPLTFDYGTFFVTSVASVALPLAAVLLAVAATVVAVVRYPKIGFPAVTALAILSPTSLIPGTTQMIVEHRMYLPLAGLVVLLVPLGGRLAGRRAFLPAMVAAAALAVVTAARNRVYQHALTLWADTVAERPDNALARSSYGAALADVGRPSAAMVQDRIALALNPDDTPTLANLSIALTENGHAAAALPYLRRAVVLDPRHANAQLNLGVTLDVLHRPAEALPHYAAAARLNPLLAAAQNDYGDALSRAGRHEAGIRHLRRALELDPHYADAYLNLAAALVRAGHEAAGDAAFAAGLKLRPRDGTVHLNWANFLFGEGRREPALAEYRAAVRLSPASAVAHYSYATALAALHEYEPAVTEYEAAVRLRPTYAQAENNLGNTLLALNRVAAAIPHYEAAVRLRPGDASLHNNLGLAYARTGRLRAAADQFAAAVRLAPEFTNARENLAHARAQLDGTAAP